MANPKDIPPLGSERTLKYGRNVLAVGCVILVLAWVPHIEIDKFLPLGFDIASGGELSVWGLLGTVLVYYGFRFFVDCRIDVLAWYETYGETRPIRNPDLPGRRHKQRLRKRFWFLDVAPPVLIFVSALLAVITQMWDLWP